MLTRSCFWSKYLDQNYHFHSKILQTITGTSVIFIIRISVLQLHIFFATTTFICFGLSLSMTEVFWVWALLYALGLRRLLIYWGNWLQSYHRGMKVPVFSTRFQRDKHGSDFCVSLFNAPNNKLEYWLI